MLETLFNRFLIDHTHGGNAGTVRSFLRYLENEMLKGRLQTTVEEVSAFLISKTSNPQLDWDAEDELIQRPDWFISFGN